MLGKFFFFKIPFLKCCFWTVFASTKGRRHLEAHRCSHSIWKNRHHQIQGVSASPALIIIFALEICWFSVLKYLNLRTHTHTAIPTVVTCSHHFLDHCSRTGAKNLGRDISSVFQIYLVMGVKSCGPTFSKILLFSWSGVWKPRALDFDIKPDYPAGFLGSPGKSLVVLIPCQG